MDSKLVYKMIEDLPGSVNWLFILTTLLTLVLFLKAVPNRKPILSSVIITWQLFRDPRVSEIIY